MVLLTVTPAVKAAIEEYRRVADEGDEVRNPESSERLNNATLGSPIEHHEIVEVSRYLTERKDVSIDAINQWRLDALLKGATIYQPPPPPKTEHVSNIITTISSTETDNSQTPQYKALMQKLREQEEQRQYERMINPPQPAETFNQRFPNAASSFGSGNNIGHNETD